MPSSRCSRPCGAGPVHDPRPDRLAVSAGRGRPLRDRPEAPGPSGGKARGPATGSWPRGGVRGDDRARRPHRAPPSPDRGEAVRGIDDAPAHPSGRGLQAHARGRREAPQDRRAARGGRRDAATESTGAVLLHNAAFAAVLATAAALAARRIRRPGMVHALWLVVLLKLLAPPLLPLAAIPRAVSSDDQGSAGESVLAGRDPSPVTQRPGQTLRDVGSAIWIGGAAAVLALAAWRSLRFRRALRDAFPAPAAIRRRTREIARQVGVSRVPRLRLVHGRVPPMLFGPPGRAEILLPLHLLERLDEPERDALIAHELAHVRRRDAWVRYVEMAGLVIFWWYPVLWWVRRGLRTSEEASCDAIVLRSNPGCARAYASARSRRWSSWPNHPLARPRWSPAPSKRATSRGD